MFSWGSEFKFHQSLNGAKSFMKNTYILKLIRKCLAFCGICGFITVSIKAAGGMYAILTIAMCHMTVIVGRVIDHEVKL